MKVGFLVRPASDECNRGHRNPAQKPGHWRLVPMAGMRMRLLTLNCDARSISSAEAPRTGRGGGRARYSRRQRSNLARIASSNVLRASPSIPMMTPSRHGRRNVSSARLSFLAARVLVLREYPPSASSPAKTAISFIPSPRFPRVPSQSVDDVKRCFANPRTTVLSEPSPSLFPLGSCSWWPTVFPFSPL